MFTKNDFEKIQSSESKSKIQNLCKKEIKLYKLLKNKNRNFRLKKKKIIFNKKIKVKMINCHPSTVYRNFLRFLRELLAVLLNLNNSSNKINNLKKRNR